MRRRVIPVAGCLAMVVLALGPVPGRAATGRIEMLGFLDRVADDGTDPGVVMLDASRRRLYVRYGGQAKISEFNLDYSVPHVLRDVTVPLARGFSGGFTGPNLDVLDEGRRVAYMIDYDFDGSLGCRTCSFIRILDLGTLTLKSDVWNLTERLPNFYAEGLTYSPVDDTIYVVGTVVGYAAFTFNTTPAPPPTYPIQVMALDAQTGRMRWAQPLTQCQRSLATLSFGAPIFRSAARAALYVPCVRADAFFGIRYSGESGLVRLSFDPAADAVGTTSFSEEFFAISGKYTSGKGVQGVAVFDPKTERVFMLSQSNESPGVWAFDGRLSAWVGFIPAHDGTAMGLGIDPATGHVYLRAGDNGQLIVTDGRATPVPQGLAAQVPTTAATDVYLVDPLTGRLFVRALPKGANRSVVTVLRDRVDFGRAQPPADYDALTTEVEEGPGTLSTYAGTANGFGARAMAVGGTGGISQLYRELFGYSAVESAYGQYSPLPALAPGDRGVFMGRVATIDVRNVGATASAQAVAADPLTDDDYRNRQNDIQRDGADVAGEAQGDTAFDATAWSWPARVCLDGEGDAVDDDHAGALGRVAVRCDKTKSEARASAHMGRTEIGGVLSVAASSFTSIVRRDAQKGIVTESIARARGIEIEVPQGGSLVIGEVAARAITGARGRAGSATVVYEPSVADVVLRDAAGTVLFRCGDSCSPRALAQAVNEAASLKMRVALPTPYIVRTPKGAFASVQETDTDYYNGLITNNDESRAVPALEVTIFNDFAEKSRLNLQFAAVQASSIYGVTPLDAPGTAVDRDVDAEAGGATVENPLADPGLLTPSSTVDPEQQEPSIPQFVVGIAQTALLLVRSPKDAVMVSLLFLLFGGAAATAARRRALIKLLQGGR